MNTLTALTRARAVIAAESNAINPVCRTRLLASDDRAARSVVFFHGLTSCPRQFEPIGQALRAQGWNVYIPRMPYHGYADRMTGDLARLTRSGLEAWAREGAEIAAALGKRAVVAGLSVGGACAALAAQKTPGLAGGLIISPFLRTPAVPARWTREAAWLFSILPNQWRWWDPVLKDARSAPSFSYPRVSTRAVAASLGLAQGVMAAARRTRPASPRLDLVLNENDKVVDLAAIRELAAAWQARGADTRMISFPTSDGLTHDLIGAEHPEQRIEAVYPVMLDALDKLAGD